MPRLVWLAAAAAISLCAQDEDFRIYRDPPRIFLNAQRLRRIQREAQRDSMRWRQVTTLIEDKAKFPEPGFFWALHHAVTGSADSARTAIDWALQPGSNDLRQLALVYDWCPRAMRPAQKQALSAKIQKLLGDKAVSDANDARSRVLAAAAIAEDFPELSEKVLRGVVKDWWRKSIAPLLNEGKRALRREEIPALYELMHVLTDNLKIDLREDARRYFKDLTTWHLVSHYPAPLMTTENEYRIPVQTRLGDPDLTVAALSRAAEMMMVAYDVNAVESQFLQGFLIQDRFLLRSAFGIPYEFLWANPYQPGLPFEKMPAFFHDALGGRFFVRSSWEEDATWFGYFDGVMQLSENGTVKTVHPESLTQPVEIGEVTILLVKSEEFTIDLKLEPDQPAHYFILGLPATTAFDIEVDDEEMYEAVSDASGILALDFAKGTKGRVLVHRPGKAPSVP